MEETVQRKGEPRLDTLFNIGVKAPNIEEELQFLSAFNPDKVYKVQFGPKEIDAVEMAASNFSYFPHSPTMIICLTPIPEVSVTCPSWSRILTNFSPISVGRGSRHSEDRTKVSSGSSASGWSQCSGLRTARSLALFLVTCSKVHDLRSGCHTDLLKPPIF